MTNERQRRAVDPTALRVGSGRGAVWNGIDSSAFLAFFFGEPGQELVSRLLSDEAAEVGVSALTSLEVWARLKAEGRPESFEREWNEHLPLFEAVVAVDAEVCGRAVEIRAATRERLPTIDAVIAASASVHDAVLVHRDPHFRAIPARFLRQVFLPSR